MWYFPRDLYPGFTRSLLGLYPDFTGSFTGSLLGTSLCVLYVIWSVYLMGTSLCVLYMNGCLSIECMVECSLSMYRYMFCDYACVLPSGDWDGNICFFNGLSDLCVFIIFVCVSVVYVLSVRCYYIDVCVLSLYDYVMCLLYRVVCVSY